VKTRLESASLGPWRLGLMALALVWTASGAQEISWGVDRPLTWDDFRGAVDASAPAKNVALTAATLGWGYEVQTRIVGADCSYRISEIRSSARFHPGRSWVRPGHRTPGVLAHEQGHFDITEVHRLMFDAAVGALAGAARPCEGKTARRVAKFIEREVEQLIGEPYERVWRKHLAKQDAYDRETGHGTNADSQRRWLELIAAALEGQRWDELAGPDR
jgi:hypothetical protein